DLARGAEGSVNMTMRQRADDGNGILVLGNGGAAFEQCLEAGDPLVRPVGEVQQRALLDLASFAVALAQQDGRGRVAIGDRFDIHGSMITGVIRPNNPKSIILHGYVSVRPAKIMRYYQSLNSGESRKLRLKPAPWHILHSLVRKHLPGPIRRLLTYARPGVIAGAL